MNNLIENIRKKTPNDLFTDTLLNNMISVSENKRYSLVKRALKKNEIVRLKRGLYAFGAVYQKKGINLFQAAQMIYGPSYISLESALSYHNWIPEAVYTVTSVSLKRGKKIKTPFGTFSYLAVPIKKFFTGVIRVQAEGVFLMASPWRALADYVYVYKKNWKGLKPVVESLRVDQDMFKNTDIKMLEELRDSFRSRRVKVFIEKCRKELI